MKRVGLFFTGLYYSLPIQLLIVQVRYQKFILITWFIFFLLVTKNFGEALGIPFLLLDPEYLGEVNSLSMFLLGCGLGMFITCYMIASFISNSFRFYFLAFEYRPFTIFFLNNLIIPVAFLILYSVSFIDFQSYVQGKFNIGILKLLGSFYLGVGLVIILIMIYFVQTHKNFVSKIGEKLVKEMKGSRVIIEKARAGLGIRIRVDYFLRGFFRIEEHDPSEPADFRKMVRILNLNHGNALFLQLILFAAMLGIGFLEDRPVFQLPSGMSLFMLCSILLMLISATTFWFRRLGPFAILFALAVFIIVNNFNVIKHKHPAFGMNYNTAPAQYSPENLFDMSSAENIKTDIEHTKRVLDSWASYQRIMKGPDTRLRPVIICVSGGGLRSAYFATRIMQSIDSLCGGGLMEDTRLITGASGGMIGAAYYRELFIGEQLEQYKNIWEKRYATRITGDLLNRVSMKIVTGLFLPTMKETVGDDKYNSDRGWSFDRQLIDNLGVFENRRMGDYVPWVEGGLAPQMIFSPVIINDGRKLYMSSLQSSYLTRGINYGGNLEPGITGIDFRRFFKEQEADSIMFVTALRMNASFPFITPYVRLPSEPPISVMDAGLADNYGLETAARYLQTFGKWYLENMDSLLLIQIRDSKVISTEVPEYQQQSFIKQFIDPIGATYDAFYLTSDIANEQYFHQIDNYLEGKVKYAIFQYVQTDSSEMRASLSWHLTRNEVGWIEHSLENDHNQEAFMTVKKWMKK